MSRPKIADTLRKGKILVSDGAWGTLLQAGGLAPGQCPELWCLEHPAEVRDIAKGYFEAGSDMTQTNSFGGTVYKLEHFGLAGRAGEINEAAARLSREAAGEDKWVIASVGPTGKMLMMGDITEEELKDSFRKQAAALARGGADALCIETMSAVDEAALAVRAARESTDLEVICTFTFERTLKGEYRTMMGVSPGQAGKAALEAGADRIDLAADLSQFHHGDWSLPQMLSAAGEIHGAARLLGVQTPRVTTDRELEELAWLLERLEPDVVLVHNLGALSEVRRLRPDGALVADFSFNVFNSAAAGVLAEQGAAAVTASLEAGWADLAALCSSSPLPVELFAHGPLPGMVLEHCVLAAHLSAADSKDLCRGICQYQSFSLRDRNGQSHPILTDQYCRNHLMAARELLTLPWLGWLCGAGVRVFRLQLALCGAATVGELTRLYVEALDTIKQGQPFVFGTGHWQRLETCTKQGFSAAALVQSAARPPSTLEALRRAAV